MLLRSGTTIAFAWGERINRFNVSNIEYHDNAGALCSRSNCRSVLDHRQFVEDNLKKEHAEIRQQSNGGTTKTGIAGEERDGNTRMH
jgi:hypothetical protein